MFQTIPKPFSVAACVALPMLWLTITASHITAEEVSPSDDMAYRYRVRLSTEMPCAAEAGAAGAQQRGAAAVPHTPHGDVCSPIMNSDDASSISPSIQQDAMAAMLAFLSTSSSSSSGDSGRADAGSPFRHRCCVWLLEATLTSSYTLHIVLGFYDPRIHDHEPYLLSWTPLITDWPALRRYNFAKDISEGHFWVSFSNISATLNMTDLLHARDIEHWHPALVRVGYIGLSHIALVVRVPSDVYNTNHALLNDAVLTNRGDGAKPPRRLFGVAIRFMYNGDALPPLRAVLEATAVPDMHYGVNHARSAPASPNGRAAAGNGDARGGDWNGSGGAHGEQTAPDNASYVSLAARSGKVVLGLCPVGALYNMEVTGRLLLDWIVHHARAGVAVFGVPVRVERDVQWVKTNVVPLAQRFVLPRIIHVDVYCVGHLYRPGRVRHITGQHLEAADEHQMLTRCAQRLWLYGAHWHGYWDLDEFFVLTDSDEARQKMMPPYDRLRLPQQDDALLRFVHKLQARGERGAFFEMFSCLESLLGSVQMKTLIHLTTLEDLMRISLHFHDKLRAEMERSSLQLCHWAPRANATDVQRAYDRLLLGRHSCPPPRDSGSGTAAGHGALAASVASVHDAFLFHTALFTLDAYAERARRGGALDSFFASDAFRCNETQFVESLTAGSPRVEGVGLGWRQSWRGDRYADNFTVDWGVE